MINEISERVIACAFAVSNGLGSGFLEKIYENALAHELHKAGLSVAQQHAMVARYDGVVVGHYVVEPKDLKLNSSVFIRVHLWLNHQLSAACPRPTPMPKFLRIGVHQSNVSGYTSKAWWIRRSGSTVFLKWGAVEVDGVGDGRKIYWTVPPREKVIRYRAVQPAKDYVKNAIARRRNHRYEPLTGNIAIRRRPANRGREPEQALATILFVDIVRSTEKAARLGDSRWTQVMNHYYAAVRRELKALRGKEVVTTGDGLLATFDAPAAGIRCATAMREAVRTLGLDIRVGLHAGEYKVSGADVVGLAFHIGARVAAKARAGEVLVSSAVRDLMAQSEIRFKDHGVHQLKGVPKRWRLYRVDH